MIGTAPRIRIWAVLAACAGLTLSACGTSGDAGITESSQPPVLAAGVQGTVYGPSGQFAAADRQWWSWTERLLLVPRAYALLDDDLQPIQTTLDVSLSRLDPTKAVHGNAEDDWYVETFLLKTEPTGLNGTFKILDPSLSILDDHSHLMLAVGTPGVTLTRAFVLQHSTVRIDAVSEAVVRVVLKRLTEAPVAQLDDFSIDDLTAISEAAHDAAATAIGSTVLDLNQSAYDLVVTNRKVQCALRAMQCPTPSAIGS